MPFLRFGWFWRGGWNLFGAQCQCAQPDLCVTGRAPFYLDRLLNGI
jgi:hypothetical protein